MKVAILGTRGIPASYSGFETSVQETAVRFVEKGIQTVVYCRSSHYKNKSTHFKGVKLVYLPSIQSKHLDTITNTLLSCLHQMLCDYNILIVYGIGNSIFIPLLRLFSRPVISVVDGADWERKKWGNFAKAFLRFNRYFAVKFSNFYVVDNELLAESYFKKFNKMPVYIPYGANTVTNNDDSILKKYNLKKRHYIIFIGRFVKEKGIDFLVENYEKIETGMKLVLVGDNTTDKEYVKMIKSTKDQRIIFTGYVYGQDYEALLQNALFYISCSYLEGTSPSLLSAMSLNGFALVSDLHENKEVLKGTCATFETGNAVDFQQKLNYYLNQPEIIESSRIKTAAIIKKYYSWSKITDQYIALFDRIKKKKSFDSVD